MANISYILLSTSLVKQLASVHDSQDKEGQLQPSITTSKGQCIFFCKNICKLSAINSILSQYRLKTSILYSWIPWLTQIAKFMGPKWGPPGSCRPLMGPMLAPWTLLSGKAFEAKFLTFHIYLYLLTYSNTVCWVILCNIWHYWRSSLRDIFNSERKRCPRACIHVKNRRLMGVKSPL